MKAARIGRVALAVVFPRPHWYWNTLLWAACLTNLYMRAQWLTPLGKVVMVVMPLSIIAYEAYRYEKRGIKGKEPK